MKVLEQRIRRAGYIERGPYPPLWQGLLMLPVAAACKAGGWRRDSYGRLYRKVRPADPPSTLFERNSTLWMDPRHPGGERAICWSYWHAFVFDMGAWHNLIEETA